MKKITVTCDRCGKEIVRWIEVHMIPGARDEFIDVADLIPYHATMYICKECIQHLYRYAKEACDSE